MDNTELPLLVEATRFANRNAFVEYIYGFFKKYFLDNESTIFFEGKPVLARNKLLNCQNCGNHCNNDFTCDTCPFKNKLDIFQHICSDEDEDLVPLPEYKKKQNRTPGIYNRVRTERIILLKFMIENYDNNNIIRYYNGPDTLGKLNHYFWLVEKHYILILVENNNVLYIKTCYDIKTDKDEAKHYAKYQKYIKKKSEKECS